MGRRLSLDLLVLSLCCMLPNQGADAECGSVFICTLDYNPVCGTDYNTYSNQCHLEVADCLSNSTISKRSDGKCMCTGNVQCTEEYQAHCGTDGQTYDNQCYFNFAKLCSSGLTLSSLGECNTTTANNRGADPPRCHLVCTAEYDPVCGTDHKTYSNQCVLSGKQCMSPESNLQLLRKGKCNSANNIGSSFPLTVALTTVVTILVSVLI